MSNDPKEEILRAKTELKRAEHAFNRWNSLNLKREELDTKLEILRDDMHKNVTNMHQKESFDPVAAAEIEADIIRQKNMIAELKTKKRDLDTLLDSLEENSEDNIRQLRENLINIILRHHSDQNSSYGKMQADLRYIEESQYELKEIKTMCEKMMQFLGEAIGARHKVRRLGVLSYIFGSNPNMTISHYLQASDELAKLALPVLDKLAAKTQAKSGLGKVYGETILFLQEFRSHSRQRWGFRKIDTKITQAFERLNEILHSIKKEDENLTKQKLDVEDKIEVWIDNHAN